MAKLQIRVLRISYPYRVLQYIKIKSTKFFVNIPCDRRYRGKFNKLKQELEGLFPGLLDITGEGTPGVTGYFEVQVVGGKLLHSKKNGNGFVDSAAKMQTIVDGVKAALDERS
ncbi:selenoprotein W-like [Daphnia magna]|uniref:selenoprotein W-like n=1 Tax=Daphnia magna TaxID=35525 RepID=UPI001403DBDF|nr:selenoprotein W-like [Daphnia magna]